MSDNRSRISVQIQDALFGEIRARAVKEKVKVSDIVRSALVSYLSYNLPADLPRPSENSGKNPGKPKKAQEYEQILETCTMRMAYSNDRNPEEICPACGNLGELHISGGSQISALREDPFA